MKRLKHMWRSSNLFLILIGVCCHAWAQNVAFIASPSSTKIGLNDQLQVEFKIINVENLKELGPTSFGDFNKLAGPFQSTSVSFSNGAKSSSVSLTYVLQARHEGKLTIAPATAKDAAGHVYQSNPITIEVVPGTLAQQQARRPQRANPFGDDDDPFAAMAQQMQRVQQMQQQMQQQMMGGGGGPRPQPGQPPTAQQQKAEADANNEEIKKDLFIKVSVDKSKVHVGEQITTSYKLYSRIPMSVNFSKLPSLNGFWTQDFEIPRQPKPTEEVIDGKKYQVFLLKKSALFPQETGTLELDPAEAKGVARITQRARPMNGTLMMNDPFFNNAFFSAYGYKDVNVHLVSTPVKVTVTPLPEKDKPSDFSGGVGNFTFTGKLDKQELTTDDVATLTLNITGSGNLKLIEAPKLNLPNGINTYDPQIVDTITGRSTVISGSKYVTFAITPHTTGDYEIPPVSFSYYNTQTNSYITLHTQAFKLHVKPGKHYNPSQQAAEPNNSFTLKDIHDINQKPLGELRYKGYPLLMAPGYWSAYALPLFAFLLLAVYKKKNDELNKNVALLKNKRANKVALQRLDTAKKMLARNETKGFHEEISKAIWLYLSDKSGIPLSALSKETAIAAMRGRNVSESLQKKFDAVIWECETALYASGAAKPLSQTYDDAVRLISDLEGVI